MAANEPEVVAERRAERLKNGGCPCLICADWDYTCDGSGSCHAAEHAEDCPHYGHEYWGQ